MARQSKSFSLGLFCLLFTGGALVAWLASPEGLLHAANDTATVAPDATLGTAPTPTPGAGKIASDLADSVDNADAPPQPKLFDWPQPEFALFITGRQNGYIEPCGCTGLANQKGGLARRFTLLEQINALDWNVVPVDGGNQVRRFGRQAEIKFQTTIQALNDMNYQAVALGPDDLRLSIGELIAAIGVDDQPSPVISANASVLGFNKTHRVIQSGKYRIGVAAILGSKEQMGIQSAEIEFSAAAEGLRRAHAALKKESCNMYVLLAHAATEQTLELARQFQDFRVVITAGGADEPALQPERIPGTKASYLIQTGKKGMYVGVLGVYTDPKTPIRFERVALDDRFADAPSMLASLKSYQQQLKAQGLRGLGLKPVKHPTGYQFLGSEACADCHDQAYEKWLETPHHHATEAIAKPTERSEIVRHFDPECLSCHVTGWEPQNYFPFEAGYLDYEASAHLHGNGCENCHGPGSAHVAAESGDVEVTDDQLMQLRLEMRLPLSEARDRCLDCHDLDNDPNFQAVEAFDEYWSQIEHYED